MKELVEWGDGCYCYGEDDLGQVVFCDVLKLCVGFGDEVVDDDQGWCEKCGQGGVDVQVQEGVVVVVGDEFVIDGLEFFGQYEQVEGVVGGVEFVCVVDDCGDGNEEFVVDVQQIVYDEFVEGVYEVGWILLLGCVWRKFFLMQ